MNQESERIRIKCAKCGGTNISKDASAAWNEIDQCWELMAVYDKPNFCEDCDGEVSLIKEILTN